MRTGLSAIGFEELRRSGDGPIAVDAKGSVFLAVDTIGILEDATGDCPIVMFGAGMLEEKRAVLVGPLVLATAVLSTSGSPYVHRIHRVSVA